MFDVFIIDSNKKYYRNLILKGVEKRGIKKRKI